VTAASPAPVLMVDVSLADTVRPAAEETCEAASMYARVVSVTLVYTTEPPSANEDAPAPPAATAVMGNFELASVWMVPDLDVTVELSIDPSVVLLITSMATEAPTETPLVAIETWPAPTLIVAVSLPDTVTPVSALTVEPVMPASIVLSILLTTTDPPSAKFSAPATPTATAVMVASSWATTEMLLAVEVTFEFAMSAVRLSAMSLEATAAPIAAAPFEMPTAPAPLPIDESSMAVTVTLPVTVTVELPEMEAWIVWRMKLRVSEAPSANMSDPAPPTATETSWVSTDTGMLRLVPKPISSLIVAVVVPGNVVGGWYPAETSKLPPTLTVESSM